MKVKGQSPIQGRHSCKQRGRSESVEVEVWICFIIPDALVFAKALSRTSEKLVEIEVRRSSLPSSLLWLRSSAKLGPWQCYQRLTAADLTTAYAQARDHRNGFDCAGFSTWGHLVLSRNFCSGCLGCGIFEGLSCENFFIGPIKNGFKKSNEQLRVLFHRGWSTLTTQLSGLGQEFGGFQQECFSSDGEILI